MITWLSMSTIKDIPKTDNVITCRPQEDMATILHTLNDKGIGAIVITDESEKVVGVFTERDFLRKLSGKSVDELKTIKISEVMTPEPKTVTEDDRVDFAFGLMRVGRFRHLIVVDKDYKCAGMISIKDAFDYICDMTQ